MYIGTLTLALVLAVFGALLLAIALSNQLAQPLLLLAEGVAQVARGDFSSKAVFASRDELGGLTRSFAEMTDAALGRARAGAEERGPGRGRARQPADHPRQPDRRRDRVRPQRRDRHRQSGRHPDPAPAALGLPRPPARRGAGHRPVRRRRSGSASSCTPPAPRPASATTGRTRSSCRPAARRARERPSITLLVRGAAMPQGARLMVFDDITELVSAQRIEAWSEVARRLAHEIKNPLTPIQLSAERLQLKLVAQARGHRPGDAAPLGRHHRQPGPGDEDAGQRVPRLRPAAGLAARPARPQRPGGRGARPVRLDAGVGAPASPSSATACRRSSATAPSCAR